MKFTRSALLRACLLASIPITSFAQTEPVVFEAESGTLGASLTTGVSGTTTYVTTTANRTTPPSVPFIATHSVTFPSGGNWELYARIQVGPNGANDDSFYFGQGFITPVPETGAWALQNEANTGFTNPASTVLVGGSAGSNVFKWIKITGAQGPNPWVVPAGSLTQTFQWGTREDGLFLDKFAFGRAGVCYTVANLDNGQSATGVCPPPPPPDPPPYTRTDPAIGTGITDKYLGGAWSPGTASLSFANYWNQVTPENGGKWGTAEPQRDVFNWAQADEAYALAKANGFPFKWHTLIWGNQQPAWIEGLTTAEQREEIEEWFAAVAARYPDIDQIEVVNEPLHDPPRGPTNGNYIEALGGNGVTGWDWVITSFQLARQYFPNAELILNDYSITNDNNATTNYIALLQLLKDRGLVDAIGDQAHAFSTTEAAPMNNHRNNLNRLAALGMPIYITELDIDGVLQGVVHHETQLNSFKRIFPVFWEHPAVKGVTIWGYVRGFHWRNNTGAWLLYPNGGERPALQWLIRYVQNKPTSIAAQSLSVSESAAAGAVVGTVVATDGDADTVFSQWQINSDPSGKFVIDPATGTVSLAAGASLDFETFTSHSITVSVWDGYVRSAAGSVTIKVTNANDNAPKALPGEFKIDEGDRGGVGLLYSNGDADDTNEPGFTTFSGWAVAGGTGASVFTIVPETGVLQIKAPSMIDFSLGRYTVLATVSDGQNTSEPVNVTVLIPNRIKLCVPNKGVVTVAKHAAAALVRQGASLGGCGPPPKR
jgi:endo-1,4-beta-xylanase